MNKGLNKNVVEHEAQLESAPKTWQKAFTMSDGVWILDSECRILQSNGRFEHLLGMKTEDIIGKHCYDVAHYPRGLIKNYPFTKMKESGLCDCGEYEDSKRGLRFRVTIDPICDSSGTIVRAVHTMKDITGRKHAEEELEQLIKDIRNKQLQSEKMATVLKKERDTLQIIMENTGTHLAYLDSKFNFIRVNSAFAKGTGYKKGELIGRNHFELFPDPQKQAIFEKVRDTGKPIEFKAQPFEFADQPWRGVTYFDWALNPVKDASGNVVRLVLSLIDVTERMQVEEESRKSREELERRVKERTGKLSTINSLLRQEIIERKHAEERIREQAALLDHAQDAIAVRNLNQQLIYWNKGAERMYGWTAEEVLGKNANELLYKKESPRLLQAQKSVREGEEWRGELRQLTKEGKEIIVESRWAPVFDSIGNHKSTLIINTDITGMKNLEAQFLRAQRLESIGTLASGIAHDINNVLSPIMLSLQLLRERAGNENCLKLIDILEKSAMRGASLIKQVQLFAKGVEEGERQTLQAGHIVSEICQMVKETFPRSIEIRTDTPEDAWTISGDATQLHQVLMNLCVNARDAMPNGGVLQISAENIFIDENYARMNMDAKEGAYVAFTVMDSGTGIQPEIIDRIFEPFFTTKEQGKGTGLGLSTALAIVKSHGGFIKVYSEVGKGSSFKVYLPAVRDNGVKSIEEEAEVIMGKGELVLVVDDEAAICEITSAMLQTNGYKVLTASNGAEAISLYAKQSEDVKIILMDMMMPVMDGPTSIMELRKINPDLKIIAVSGLTEKERLAKVRETANAFISKPYTAEKLLKTISTALETK